MKAKLAISALFVCAVVWILALAGCNRSAAPSKPVAYGAYDTEPDWDDHTTLIKLGYQAARGKRIFYQYCGSCHAVASPAGPSNRSNLSPLPPLMNDGAKLNGESDEFMRNIITLGGSAVGKSPLMPPYGKTLSAADITDVIAFARAIAKPSYREPGRLGLQTSITEKVSALGRVVEGARFSVVVDGSVQGQADTAPTGTVAFYVGTTQLGSAVAVAAVPRRNGKAPFFWITNPVTIPQAGSYALTARYSGDSNYAPSTTSTMINVLHHATSSISVNATTVNYGGAVTITGIIDTAIPGSNTALKPTGIATLSGTADGEVKSGVTALTTVGASGNWEIRLSATVKPTNKESFEITYDGDSNYGATSAYSSLVAVNLPDFSLTASPGSLIATPGQDGSSTIRIAPLTNMSSTVVLTCSDPLLVNVTCTVSPSSIRLANHTSATATVTLTPLRPSSSGTASALANLHREIIRLFKPASTQIGGSCVCAAPFMLLWVVFARKRSYRLALGMAGSCVALLAFGFEGGSDANRVVPTTVAIATSTTKMAAAGTPSLTLTARVTSSKAATGMVNFWENGNDKAIGLPAVLTDGAATTQVALSSPGTHEIYAEYSGDANNQASRSATIAVVATGSARARILGATGPVIHEASVDVTIQ